MTYQNRNLNDFGVPFKCPECKESVRQIRSDGEISIINLRSFDGVVLDSLEPINYEKRVVFLLHNPICSSTIKKKVKLSEYKTAWHRKNRKGKNA